MGVSLNHGCVAFESASARTVASAHASTSSNYRTHYNTQFVVNSAPNLCRQHTNFSYLSSSSLSLSTKENPPLPVVTKMKTRRSSSISSSRLYYSSIDSETAAALIFPLLVYKAAAIINGQKLQWYLDASISIALVAFIGLVSKSV
mmetsp:Transcript_53298/g.59571  ORF Transcript_53298/g.59571 Transcript_53298/m.59571 type:complete len:146 (-) Transcript_53298:150-587(-)